MGAVVPGGGIGQGKVVNLYTKSDLELRMMIFLFWGILYRGMIQRIFFVVFQRRRLLSIRTWFHGRGLILFYRMKIIMKSLPRGCCLFRYLFVPIPIPTGTTTTLTTHVHVLCSLYPAITPLTVDG